MNRLVQAIQKVLDRFGIVAVRKRTFDAFVAQGQTARRYAILALLSGGKNIEEFFRAAELSKSQLDQDLAALANASFKRGGFFVEFGATNGITLSNTFLLEKHYGWSGVLAEPGREWQDELRASREAKIFEKAVFSEGGLKLEFLEDAELSTLSSYKGSDNHLRRGKTYEVETITLNELLSEAQAPAFIDFMSVDTEGSEFEALSGLDFDKYSFGFICVEHNFTQSRGRVIDLLQSKGYRRVLDDVSEWDDWFIPADSQ